MATRWCKNFEDMYNCLDIIPACVGRTDRQTDGRTSCHGIVRAMHTRLAVKTVRDPYVYDINELNLSE